MQRNSTTSYFLTVPEGAKALEVGMSALRSGSQTRFISIHPYGVPVDDTGTPSCYPNYDNPANTCRPELRSYPDPAPGVWEIEVEARRTSPYLDNPYKLDVALLGAAFDPAVQTLPEAEAGTAAPVDWTVRNGFAAIDGTLKGGPLGSSFDATPTIEEGESKTTTVTVPEGVDRFDVSIGGTSDTGADLDLYVYRGATQVGSSATGGSDESVSLVKPAAGTYTVEVDAYAVPAGSTTYGYRDVYFAPSLGSVEVDASKAVKLATGASAKLGARIVAAGPAPAGRELFGQVQLLNARGTVAGTGSVRIAKVTP